MADIAWSAYALAMFTPEQRAAAVNAVYEPPDDLRPIPPVVPVTQSTIGFLVQVGSRLLNPNIPGELQQIHAAGWRYEGGRWIAPGAQGTAATPDQVLAQTGGRIGLSSVAPVSFIPGGSVLGTTVPTAPPVLLPSFVGGRLGVVRLGGGLRPESGGTPRRVVMGPGSNILPVVRMGVVNWGR